MDPSTLLSKINVPCADVSHVIREVFQGTFEHDVVPKHLSESMQQTCAGDAELKQLADTVHQTYEIHENLLSNVRQVEEGLMERQATHLLHKDATAQDQALLESLKLKQEPVFEEMDKTIVAKYKLIQARDLLPPLHERVLDFQVTGKIFCPTQKQLAAKEDSYIHKLLQKKPNSLPPILPTDNRMKGKLPKKEFVTQEMDIFVAKPNFVLFTDYEVGKIYKQSIRLVNVSSQLGYFTEAWLPKGSRFSVCWHTLPGNGLVAPGLSVTLWVQFHCDSLGDCEDYLVTKGPGCLPVEIPLVAERELPLLEVLDLLGVCDSEIPEHIRALGSSIECGRSLISRTVSISLLLHCSRGNGRFWLMSETEWCSTVVQGLSMDKDLLIPPFKLSPIYFMMMEGDVIELEVQFSPDSCGMQVEKLFILCDNCCICELEILGDGVFFSKNFILFENMEKSFNADIDDDEKAEYFLNFGKALAGEPIQKTFTIRNTSSILLSYRWDKREAEVDSTLPRDFYPLPAEAFNVIPSSGKIEPFERRTFTVDCCYFAPNAQYRHILRLMIVDVPEASLLNNSPAYECVSSVCPGCVDVITGEVELWLEVVPPVIYLVPCLLYLPPGSLRVEGKMLARQVQIANGSIPAFQCCWKMSRQQLRGTNTCSLWVEPLSFVAPGQSSVNCTVYIKGHSPGSFALKLRCVVANGLCVMELLLVGQVEYPTLRVSTHLLNLDLVKAGTVRAIPLTVSNNNSTEIIWYAREYRFDCNIRKLVLSKQRGMSADAGLLCHPNSQCDIEYKAWFNTKQSQVWCHLLVLSAVCESCQPTEFSYTLLLADVVAPDVNLHLPHREMPLLSPYGRLYVGHSVTCEVVLRNHTWVSTNYCWSNPIGEDSFRVKVTFHPAKGTVPPAGTMPIKVTILPLDIGAVDRCFALCFMERWPVPLALAIVCSVEGLIVSVQLPNSAMPFKWPVSGLRYLSLPCRNNMWASSTQMTSSTQSLPPALMLQATDISMTTVGDQVLASTDESEQPTSSSASNSLPYTLEVSKAHGERSRVPVRLQSSQELGRNTIPVEVCASVAPALVFQPKYQEELEGQECTSVMDPAENTLVSSELLIDQSSYICGQQLHVTRSSESSLRPAVSAGTLCASAGPTSVEELGLPNSINFRDVPCYKAVSKTFVIRNETPIASNVCIKIKNFHEKRAATKPDLLDEIKAEVYMKTKDDWSWRMHEGAGLMITADPSSAELESFGAVLVTLWVYATTWGTYWDELACLLPGLPPLLMQLSVQVTGHPLSLPSEQSVLRFEAMAYRGPPQVQRLLVRNNSCVAVSVVWHVFLQDGSSQPFSLMLDMFTPLRTRGRHKRDGLSNSDIELSLAPYYGEEDLLMFKVRPREVFIPSKSSVSVLVVANPLFCSEDGISAVEILGTMVGYVRVIEKDSIHPGLYNRPSGSKLPPITINIAATVEVPLLSVDHTKADTTFHVSAIQVMSCPDQSYRMRRTFTFFNRNKATVTALFSAFKPFHVLEVSTLLQQSPRQDCSALLMSGQCAKVLVECFLTAEDINKAYGCVLSASCSSEKGSKRAYMESALTISQGVSTPKQTLQLELHLVFPTLQVSSEILKFGCVFVRNTKLDLFCIRNESEVPVHCVLKMQHRCAAFHIDPTELDLPARTVAGSIPVQIKVSFTPQNSEVYEDVILIETCIPEDVKMVQLTGTGTLNEKYRVRWS